MLKTASVAIAYQLAWCATAYGAAHGMPSLGISACLAVLALAVWVADDRRSLALLIVALGGYGLGVETLLRATGLVSYSSPGPIAGLAPAWIVVLWMAFGALVPLTMSWLRGRLALAALFGALLAPLSYVAAERFGALQISTARGIGLIVIAVAWSVVVPVALRLSARRADRFR